MRRLQNAPHCLSCTRPNLLFSKENTTPGITKEPDINAPSVKLQTTLKNLDRMETELDKLQRGAALIGEVQEAAKRSDEAAQHMQGAARQTVEAAQSMQES